MRFAPLVERIAGDAADAWDLHYTASQQARHDRNVIILSVGDPDMDTPNPIVESAVDRLRAGRTHYSFCLGEPDLRQAVANYYNRDVVKDNDRGGEPVSADDVIIVPGAQSGLFASVMCILGLGDEVIIPEPMYVTYPGVVAAAGGSIVTVSMAAEQQFVLDVDAVVAAITSKTRAIWINSPHNPTGSVIDRPTLDRLAELCELHDLWLISDEVYREIVFDGEAVSLLEIPNLRHRAIVVSSLSKSHAMSGWRMGWVVVPEPLRQHMDSLLGAMLYSSPTFTQDAAVTALSMPAAEFGMAEIYARRLNIVTAALDQLDTVHCHRPPGGVFVMADVRPTGLTGQGFAQRLYDSKQVSVLAADPFGPSAAGHVRISLTVADERLTEGMARLVDFVRDL